MKKFLISRIKFYIILKRLYSKRKTLQFEVIGNLNISAGKTDEF